MPQASDYFAVVTGGGGGIGRQLCQQLAAAGATVAVVDINPNAAEATCDLLPGGEHLAIPCDVAHIEAWQQFRDQLQQSWPRLDLLVNNAGVLMGGLLADCSSEETQRLVEVNLLGTLYGCQTLVPWLIDSQSAMKQRNRLPKPGVINTGSIFATLSPPGFGVYSAAKAGVVAISESLRGELAPAGLNVTVTLPGVTQTALFTQGGFASPAFRDATLESVEKGSMTPEVVARKTLAAAQAGRLYAPIGRRATWYWRLKHWAPRQTIAAVAAQARKTLGIAAKKAKENPPPS